MGRFLFSRFSGPLVALGGLVAVACLASTWYINRLQSDLARAVRQDAAQLEAANELQIWLRQLRTHSLMLAADPNPVRQEQVSEDRRLVAAALTETRGACHAPEDMALLETIERGYHEYEASLGADTRTGVRPLRGEELIRWADAHPVQGLLVPCRELAERQRYRMDRSVEQSETQTTWAGRVLLGLAFTGALGGLLSGYATARGLTRRAAQLSVRVQAVQSQLDQEIGAVTVEAQPPAADLDEQLDRVIGRVRDVCHKLQEQERDLLRAEQLAAVGQLAAGVAHEVRNPLTGIKFLIEGALRTEHPTLLTGEDLRLIRQEIVRIERTIQGLLDFARMPSPTRRPHDLRVLVAEAAGLARSRAERKSVAVLVELPEIPVPVSVDRDQMLSLLTNLLFNALDATPPGGEVGVGVSVGQAGMMKVEVTDTGPGIDPAIAARLFTPFATTKSTGTGLGLTVARRVARDHNGTLTAANRTEGGAVFTLELPTGEAGHAPIVGR